MKLYNCLSILLFYWCTHGLCAESGSINNSPIGQQDFRSLPIHFIENQGQVNEEVFFYCKGRGKSLYFAKDHVIVLLKKKEGDEVKVSTVRLCFLDANPNVKLLAQSKQQTNYSFFKGKREHWKTKVPCYGKVVYQDLWQDIDLVYYGRTNKIKYEFIVKPGADPKTIRLAYKNAQNVTIDQNGYMVVSTDCGSIKDIKPKAYQMIGGQQIEVSMAYNLIKKNHEKDIATFNFKLGDYDPKEILYMDPAILLFCGYIGGSKDEYYGDIDIDKYNNLYVTGVTDSDEII